VDGWADVGYGAVADEFAANFSQRGELGAAVTLFVDGRMVVDLWGGVADRETGRPWSKDTVAVVFSCTKGVVALCVATLVERGLIELDAPVARYWPEFGQGGKRDITVRCLLSHRAGLPVVDRALTLQDVLSWTPVVHALEEQVPLWTPGSAYAYHALTYGWLAGELIRRVTGHTPGSYFRQRFVLPLHLNTWIGFPRDQMDRLARLAPHPVRPDEACGIGPVSAFQPSPMVADVPTRAVTMNGAIPFPGLGGEETFNDASVLAAEIPGANGVSTARGLAKLYAAAVGGVAGAEPLAHATITDFIKLQSVGLPWVGGPNGGLSWGSGFMLDSPPARPMLGPRSFGHDGASGSLAFGDDEHRVGFGYINNSFVDAPDTRANVLTAAVRRCL
jgi:CubicO group peptidase (beta-lactamase class C family)